MQEKELKDILDLVYEIEGLTELALKRDNPPKAIGVLIKTKTQQLSELVAALDGAETDNEEAEDKITVSQSGETCGDVADEEADEYEYDMNSEDEFYKGDNTYPEDNNRVNFPKTTQGKVDLKSLFSINDKFRFRRELFSNSGNEFSDALHLVATMESMEEAEDYFYNDLQWDPDSEDVMDFMSKIAQYFGQ
jgi:hypothetical protein